MQPRIGAAREIDGVVLEAAAHEDEVFLDPVRIAKTQNVGIEFRGAIRIGRVKRHMAEFVDDDAPHLFARRRELPLRKQLDLPAVDIGENQRPRYSRQMIGADIGFDAEVLELLADVAKFDVGTDLEGHRLAAGRRILLEDEREFAGFGGEQRATGLPLDKAEPDDRLIIFDLLLDISRRETRVPDAFDLYHRNHPRQSRVMMILPSALPESSSSCAWRTSDSLKRANIAGLMVPSARWPIMRFMMARRPSRSWS